MNNKLLARLVAVVMAVALLGTVAFAAVDDVAPTYDKTAGEIDIDFDKAGFFTGQGYKTFLAFYSNDAEAEAPAAADDVVAVLQGQYPSGSFPKKIAIDTTKTAKDYIIVQYSGTSNNPVRVAIDVRDKDEFAVLEVLEELVIGGVTYKDVVVAEETFTCKEGYVVSDFGIHFTKDGSTNPGAKISALADGKTLVSGGGEVTFKAAILGVPEGTTLVAKSYINYQ